MKLALCVLLVACLPFVSCESPKEKTEFTLTDDQLYHLLNDMFLSEALLSGLKDVNQDSVRQLFWLRMTEVYKMDEQALRDEVEKIQADPEKLKYVLDRVKQEIDSIK